MPWTPYISLAISIFGVAVTYGVMKQRLKDVEDKDEKFDKRIEKIEERLVSLEADRIASAVQAERLVRIEDKVNDTSKRLNDIGLTVQDIRFVMKSVTKTVTKDVI